MPAERIQISYRSRRTSLSGGNIDGMNPFTSPQLDRDLLAGADPHRDPALERRGEKVCARRNREKLAAALEAVVARAERRDNSLTSSAPVHSHEVLEARTPLLDLACRLRCADHVDPQGVLLARRMLTDPASVLNSRSAGLAAAVRRVNAALNPR
jgi:hypothetical protein